MNMPTLSDVRIRLEPDGHYLVMNKNGRLLKINKTAKFIAEKFNGENSVEDVGRLLYHKYDISLDKAISEVNNFIKILSKSKLLK